jgi:Radical SAM superfamily
MTRMELIEGLIERYPGVPPEAVVKEDLLRTGIAFDESALSDNLDGAVKPKSYFIFSFDQKPLAELGEAATRRPPEEIALTGGPHGLRRTIVSVRVNPSSPWRVVGSELTLEGRVVAGVELPPMPAYYRHLLANGKTVMETAPTIQWGYLIYLTVLRLCQYFGAKEECRFCDINHNWRQHKQAGRPYTGIKPVEDVLEALAIIDAHDDGASHAYTLTGGSVTSQVDGLAEADFYGRYAEAIEERFPGRWIGKVVAQALPREEVQRYRDYGISIYHPNYEVWDERLFSIICPGKERYVGRGEWHRRILDAAEVFGPRYVIPNFVAGVEMARPFGFASVDEAIVSTVEGLDFFMSRGVTPRFTTWCPEPTTPLGRDNPEGAPLEYHVRLLEAYRDTLERHGLQPPPGYGKPGAGNAVFSVSSFMDVLAPEVVPV